MFNKMCIIGVGLIGGSIARASRKNKLCKSIVGVGRHLENLEKAVELGVIDSYTTDIERAVIGADLVVVCTPVGSFTDVFTSLKLNWSEDCLYTDVGSTKGSVVNALQQVFAELPANFVLAHPIAGSENNGVEASIDSLFSAKRTIITPIGSVTNDSAIQQCKKWWEGMGASVTEMTVEHHDEVLAATSHLPHVIAFALVELLRNKEDKKDILKYAAGGFKDFTRIASSDPDMWADICMANANQIVGLLDEFQKLNQGISSLIESGDRQGLRDVFKSAQTTRNNYLKLQENR
ncbi:MAG: prephenate dehydrogenase [Piscirickettsiaceae bacterium]|nr:MAG: prephenate dehydrogenase [Piscirickettsiaceae bacterium]